MKKFTREHRNSERFQMEMAAAHTAFLVATTGAKPRSQATGSGSLCAQNLVNPHSYSSNPIEATGKIYRKVADKIIKKRFRKMSPEKRKNVVWFSTFEKLEEMTDGASENIVLAIDCLFDACIAIHGPGKAFDEDIFIEHALHGGPEDSSMALSRLKVANAALPSALKNYILVDALMQMHEWQFQCEYGDDAYISWSNLPSKNLVKNLVFLSPVAYDLGLGCNDDHVASFYERMLSAAREQA